MKVNGKDRIVSRMCQSATVAGPNPTRHRPPFPRLGLALAVLLAATIPPRSSAQSLSPAGATRTLNWRQIGATAFETGLASPAGGPVARVWYSANGRILYALTSSGRIFETSDFESWREVSRIPVPPAAYESPVAAPEPGARVVRGTGPFSRLLYAFATSVYRSEDQGRHWEDMIRYRGQSIIGDGIADLAVSPLDGEEIAVANRYGIWRSTDAGLTWSGINERMPNLPARRILQLPEDGKALRVVLQESAVEIEWPPGEQNAWRVANGRLDVQREELERNLSARLGVRITATAVNGDFIYAGAIDGQLFVSADGGRNWRVFSPGPAGAVRSIYSHLSDPRTALAALESGGAQGGGPRVLRTINAGLFWDDLTSDLPPGDAFSVTADLGTGAIYVGASAGLFFTLGDLLSAGSPTPWVRIRAGLPDAAVLDVRQDSGNHRLFVCLEGYGVFTAMAPHRFLNPRLINAADWSERPASPGSLLSVLGAEVTSARSGPLVVPVLASGEAESQIQVPFESTGSLFSVALSSREGSRALAVPLLTASPAIFVDRDGSPMVLDRDTEVLLDRMNPARAGSVIRVLTTGLGRVQPDWPTGLPAPLDNPPAVATPVRAWLDGSPVEVLSATLAPGYIGFYLVEISIPKIINQGWAELYLEAGGQRSNRVALFLVH